MPNDSTTTHDVTVHQKRKLTDEELFEKKMQEIEREKTFVKKALVRGTSKDVCSVDPIVGFQRFYEAELAPRIFDKLRYYVECYVEARDTKNSAVVFVHFPRKFESEEAYSAFWIRDGEVIQLVEPETITLAKRIFQSLMQ